MEKLLRYYEHEISLLRRDFRELAKPFPKMAEKLGLLGEQCDDPQVERLAQSTALLETTNSALTLERATTSPSRVFIDAEGAAGVALYDAIFTRTLCTCVAKEEAFLPTPRRQEESLRLLSIGRADGDLVSERHIDSGPIRIIRKPSAPLVRPDQPDAHWNLIAVAHASQRNLAQFDLPALLGLLRMHARPESAVTARQLSGIVGVSRREVKEWMKFKVGSALTRGYEVTLTIDEEAFTERSIFAFAQVMERVLAYYLTYPNFLRLIVLGKDGQERIRSALRHGPQSPA